MSLCVMFVDQIVANLRISMTEVKENTAYVGQLEKHFSQELRRVVLLVLLNSIWPSVSRKSPRPLGLPTDIIGR